MYLVKMIPLARSFASQHCCFTFTNIRIMDYHIRLVLHDIDIFMLDISSLIYHDICKYRSHNEIATHCLLLHVNYTLVWLLIMGFPNRQALFACNFVFLLLTNPSLVQESSYFISILQIIYHIKLILPYMI